MQCHPPISDFHVNCREPPSYSQCVHGVVNLREGKTLLFVTSFSLRLSTQKRQLPSFFRTSTTGDDKALSDYSVTPLHFLSSNRIFTSGCFAKGNLRRGWRTGRASPLSILWYTFSVRPYSPPICLKDFLVVLNELHQCLGFSDAQIWSGTWYNIRQLFRELLVLSWLRLLIRVICGPHG